MADFYAQLQEFLDEGLDVAVATIIQTKGSTPRAVGTKMLVHPYGKHVGTIGGFGNIGVDIGGLATGTGHQGNGLCAALVVDIHHHNRGPFLGKEQGRFTTNATTTTCDETNFIL